MVQDFGACSECNTAVGADAVQCAYCHAASYCDAVCVKRGWIWHRSHCRLIQIMQQHNMQWMKTASTVPFNYHATSTQSREGPLTKVVGQYEYPTIRLPDSVLHDYTRPIFGVPCSFHMTCTDASGKSFVDNGAFTATPAGGIIGGWWDACVSTMFAGEKASFIMNTGAEMCVEQAIDLLPGVQLERHPPRGWFAFDLHCLA